MLEYRCKGGEKKNTGARSGSFGHPRDSGCDTPLQGQGGCVILETMDVSLHRQDVGRVVTLETGHVNPHT